VDVTDEPGTETGETGEKTPRSEQRPRRMSGEDKLRRKSRDDGKPRRVSRDERPRRVSNDPNAVDRSKQRRSSNDPSRPRRRSEDPKRSSWGKKNYKTKSQPEDNSGMLNALALQFPNINSSFQACYRNFTAAAATGDGFHKIIKVDKIQEVLHAMCHEKEFTDEEAKALFHVVLLTLLIGQRTYSARVFSLSHFVFVLSYHPFSSLLALFLHYSCALLALFFHLSSASCALMLC
jgi:hypothetical protein